MNIDMYCWYGSYNNCLFLVFVNFDILKYDVLINKDIYTYIFIAYWYIFLAPLRSLGCKS